MNWQDKGYLLSLTKYNENSSIAEFYTENHGKIVGVIFGSSSKKIKNYLLIGNKFHINSKIREDGKLGYLKVEIDEIQTPIYLDDKKKLYCIIYCMNLIKILTVENEKNSEIYLLINKLFDLLKNESWLSKFLFLELNIFKLIGYDQIPENQKEIYNGFILVGDFLDKTIIKPNNKIYPLTRNNFVSQLK